MRKGFRRIRVVGLLLSVAVVINTAATATAGQAEAAWSSRAVSSAPAAPHPSCNRPAGGRFHCLSYWHRTDQPNAHQAGRATAETFSAATVAAPTSGLSPADLRAQYKLPTTGGKGQTIVDAYDNPKVESDLKAYRAAWKLPACTTANGCFRKVDQRGGKKYPMADPSWGVEISLDVQAVSAVCPSCKILLVEADSPEFASIGTAENTAVRLAAKVVSNSYGADEFNGIIALGKKYYTHPGVAIVASSGDYGFQPALFPAVLKNTWAVGGTLLTATSKGHWAEEAWDSSGSGCSAWITKPAAQKDTHCGMRTVSDISAVADSDAGFAEYDTYGLGPDDGWISASGTSLSAPLIAGMIGLAGNSVKAAQPSYAYAHRSGLADVVGGSNGYCGDDYLCTGLKGYDAPTGLGSPRGLASL